MPISFFSYLLILVVSLKWPCSSFFFSILTVSLIFHITFFAKLVFYSFLSSKRNSSTFFNALVYCLYLCLGSFSVTIIVLKKKSPPPRKNFFREFQHICKIGHFFRQHFTKIGISFWLFLHLPNRPFLALLVIYFCWNIDILAHFCPFFCSFLSNFPVFCIFLTFYTSLHFCPPKTPQYW